MGKITNQYFEGGQAPTATQLNTVYNSVAGDSVNNVNLDTEWAQRKHFNDSNNITSLSTFDYDGTVDFTVSNTAFTTIENVGPNKSMVSPNYSTHADVVVRVQASGLITTGTLDVNDGDGTSGQTNRNTYAFRLLMSLNSSGTPSTVTVANCTYSFTQKAQLTTQGTGLVSGMTGIIQHRNFAFSGLVTLTAGNVIDTIELQACVGHNGNTIKIQHNHIQAIIVEN
jgi:hypothetical protein